MKQKQNSIKNLITVASMVALIGLSTPVYADQIVISYIDENNVKQSLLIDSNSSDTDKALAAKLIGVQGLTPTVIIIGVNNIADLIDGIASKASDEATANAISQALKEAEEKARADKSSKRPCDDKVKIHGECPQGTADTGLNIDTPPTDPPEPNPRADTPQGGKPPGGKPPGGGRPPIAPPPVSPN